MSENQDVFHLAIPCRDLDEAEAFYQQKLLCRVARRYSDRITLDFYGTQLVCHLAPDKIDPDPSLYPRHFGITFRHRADFDTMLNSAKHTGLPFFREPFTRFPGQPEEHRSFFLRDPSCNLIEFKHYNRADMMY